MRTHGRAAEIRRRVDRSGRPGRTRAGQAGVARARIDLGQSETHGSPVLRTSLCPRAQSSGWRRSPPSPRCSIRGPCDSCCT